MPAMPKTVLEEPDETKYHMGIDSINEKIEALNDEFKDKKAQLYEKRSEMTDGQQGRNPIR